MINEKEMTSKFPSSVWIFMSISFNVVQMMMNIELFANISFGLWEDIKQPTKNVKAWPFNLWK